MKHLFAALVLLIAAAADATTYIYPKFSTPLVAGDRLVFTSADAKRLICTDLDGHVLWEKQFPQPVYLDGERHLVRDKTLYDVNPSDGSLHKLLSLGRDPYVFRQDGIAYSQDREGALRWRDPKTLKVLWQREQVESVSEATDALVFAVSAVRHSSEPGSYTLSDSTLVALDRRTGATRWRFPLLDSAFGEVRTAVVGDHVVVLDGLHPSEIVSIDMTSGAVSAKVRNDEDLLTDLQPFGNAVAVLESKRFVVREVPSLRELRSFPLPSRENLQLRILGDTLLTTGIYSAAAFDLASGAKLWEKERQVEISDPVGGALYMTDWLRDEQLTRLIRVDLRSGEERVLLTDHAEEPKPSPALLRAIAKRERKQQKKDAQRRIPIGKTLCFENRSDPWGSMLRLDEDGTFQDRGPSGGIDRGTWSRSGGVYSLRSTTRFRSLISGRLEIHFFVPQEAELLPEFRDRVEAYLAAHPSATSLDAPTLRSLEASMPCPAGAADSCTFQGLLTTGLSGDLAYQNLEGHASRAELEQLVRDIDAWIANPDKNLFRFALETYRGFTYVRTIDPHPFWPPGDASAAEAVLDSVADYDASYAPPLLLLVRCASTTLPTRARSNSPDHTPPFLTDDPMMNASAAR